MRRTKLQRYVRLDIDVFSLHCCLELEFRKNLDHEYFERGFDAFHFLARSILLGALALKMYENFAWNAPENEERQTPDFEAEIRVVESDANALSR